MEHGKKKKMMYGGMAKKKMYGGGMTKKKKMAVGGTTGKFVKDPSRKSGKRFVSHRSAMLKEIDKLKDGPFLPAI